MGELKDILLNFGAIAGFAGIIGLAVLAMLYFSQARDVRRLREWAGREPERAAEVELRAQQIASQAIAQVYDSMSTAPPATGAPNDTGAPTDTVPPPATVPPAEQVPVAAEHATEIVSQETQAHDVVAEEFGGEAEVPPLEPLEPESEEFAVAAEAAAAEASVSQADPGAGQGEDQPADESQPQDAGEPSRLTPSTPAAARAAGPLPPLPPLDTSEFTAVRTPSTPPIPDYYLSTGTTGSGTFEPLDPPAEHRSRVPFAVAGVLVAVFAVILISTQLLGGDDSGTTKSGTGGSAANRPTQNTAERSQRINRAAVTVSVLNGTNTQGLAAAASDGLNKAGFTDTTTGNLSDGTVHPSTIVYYAPGSKPEAQEVAKELAVSDLQPATDEILAAGGSVPVIVLLGANFRQ